MKRSQINAAIAWAKALLEEHDIHLPLAAYWDMDAWRANADRIDTLRRVMMGWDVTDFGTGDFDHVGGVLYTVRNGLVDDAAVGVPFCEKYIVMRAGQRLPKHYHVYKTEDIINRAGGVLSVYLWNADPATGEELDTDVTVYMDGIPVTVRPGQELRVYPGSSVTLTPYMAHVFGPAAGSGDVVCGEVSKVNDDTTDNYFLEPTYRFARIEEDEPILHPLCNEYDRVL